MVAKNLAPGAPIPAPVILPAKHSLLTAVTPQPFGDPHEIIGVKFTPEGFTTPALAQVLDAGATKSDPVSAAAESDYVSWLIELAVKRPAVWSDNAVEEVARRALAQTESALIEEKVEAGSVTGSQYLADTHCTRIGTTSVVPLIGLARLEDALADAGGQGTIYMSAGIGACLGSSYLDERDGKLYTLRGDLVVIGNFGVSGPSASSAGTDESFMFAHLGEPEVRLGEVEVYHSLDYTTNVKVVRVERPVAVTWNPGQWATLVKYAE